MLSPFIAIDRILKEIGPEVKIRIVDFHGEATSEKLAMGFYLDGRASVLFGTHTHVQTADEMIYPGGLGYITDLGMTGPVLSVLGLDPEAVIKKFTTAMPQRFTTSKNEVQMCAALFDVDEKTGKTLRVERLAVR
jgi:calcineurin-like phosphoesterase